MKPRDYTGITDHGATTVRDIAQEDHPAVHVEELSRESVPGKVSGSWVFKGTRLAVATVTETSKISASMK